jgi:nucleosome assembly protein 1-like 1
MKKNKKVTFEIKEEAVKGVPEFWLKIFKNVELLADMVQDYDEPILKHLVDIKVRYNLMGFILDFHFTPNEYFENTVLTKSYDMKCIPDEEDPFSFEGPKIHKCRVCIFTVKT